eukprot:SAG22_NODE_340_length_12031_cov_9.961783_2_plen_215_part_00
MHVTAATERSEVAASELVDWAGPAESNVKRQRREIEISGTYWIHRLPAESVGVERYSRIHRGGDLCGIASGRMRSGVRQRSGLFYVRCGEAGEQQQGRPADWGRRQTAADGGRTAAAGQLHGADFRMAAAQKLIVAGDLREDVEKMATRIVKLEGELAAAVNLISTLAGSVKELAEDGRMAGGAEGHWSFSDQRSEFRPTAAHRAARRATRILK